MMIILPFTKSYRMNNIIEYKDWLFVKFVLGDHSFVVRKILGLDASYQLEYENYAFKTKVTLPSPGYWQIIGKGDQISEGDWEGIVQLISNGKISGRKQFRKYDDTTNIPALMWVRLATESGHSLLKSLGMEPGTTLVLKKNEK